MTKRAYRGTTQAEVAALSRRRIIDAALELYTTSWMDEVTLQQIAERAGVTVQTVLRHFGSKAGLEDAISTVKVAETMSERDEVATGDVEGIVEYLIRHYESIGDNSIRLLSQETRYPSLHKFMETARVLHRQWVGRVFAPYLPTEQARERFVPQLTAACDVYVWKLFRRDMGMTVDQYRDRLLDMITALIKFSGG